MSGNLFVLNNSTPQSGLGCTEIVEFTPEGRFVRAFMGGRDMETRLTLGHALTFAADGSLLAATAGPSLRFCKGGAIVQPFAGCASGVCVDTAGNVYVAQTSSLGCVISKHKPDGSQILTFGTTPAGINYGGMAVDSCGYVYIIRRDLDCCELNIYDTEGVLQNTLNIQGLHPGVPAIDAQDRLYLPCSHTSDIKVYTSDGRPIQTIALPAGMQPFGVATTGAGGLWISGTLS